MSFTAVTFLAAALVAALVAVVSLIQGGRTAARWAFAAGMMGLSLENVCSFLSLHAVGPTQFASWQALRVVALALYPVAWLSFGLTYALGDSGKALRARWTWLAAFFVVPVGLAAVFLRHLLLVEQREAGSWVFRLQWPATLIYVAVVLSSVLVLMLMERTFRASVGTIRWRIKSMILAVGVLSVVRLYVSSQALVFHSVDVMNEALMAAAVLISCLLAARSFGRSGRFKLDVYPSQLVLQRSLTAILAGVYLLAIGVIANFSARWGLPTSLGYNAFLVLAALVLLAVLLQSDRFQLKLRQVISRHFHRPQYDYRTVWKMVNDATASRVDRVDLCRSTVGLIAEVFQALSVSIWLVDEKSNALSLMASTSVSLAETQEVPVEPHELASLAAAAQEDVIDLDRSDQPWAAKLRASHPSEFKKGGNRFCFPMMGRGELLGVMVLGDRVSGAELNAQDIDLLNCVVGQVAASVMSAELSQRLLKSKELEAFQAMATFFVHDLKNAASTLQLTLQNLPVHFNDPAFREDALRGMGKSVAHINRLISRLGSLRKELLLRPAPFSVSNLVVRLLKELGPWGPIAIDTRYDEDDQIVGDAEQIEKVVTNLLINAREAIAGTGSIHVATERQGGNVVITVRDSGCGMAPDFIRRSLFRPFQTTKANGLGIGMFQSRMIVEAHQGRLNVTSEKGVGTTFEVVLPRQQEAMKVGSASVVPRTDRDPARAKVSS